MPVLDDLDEVRRPGGAALAAALAAGTGHDVVLVTALADDADGVRPGRPGPGRRRAPDLSAHRGSTPVKRRIRAGGQSLLRLDTGGPSQLGEPGAEALDAIRGAGALLVADYGRGMSRAETIRDAVAEVSRRAPVVWDPHPRGSRPVPGLRLVTPNRNEATTMSAALGIDSSGLRGLAAVSAQAAGLVGRLGCARGRGDPGGRGRAAVLRRDVPLVVPAPRVHAVDTCGAGDCFASSAALALAAGAVTGEAVQQAVLSAAEFVAAGGAAAVASRASTERPVTWDLRDGLEKVARVRAVGGTVVATGGCFDLLHAGHVATLEAARALGDCLVVCLNSDASVRRLKGPERPLVPQADRARVLAGAGVRRRRGGLRRGHPVRGPGR